VNDYGQIAFREDYRRGVARLRTRMMEKHGEPDVRCIFREVELGANSILDAPGRATGILEAYEIDALLLFRRTIREGKCQT